MKSSDIDYLNKEWDKEHMTEDEEMERQPTGAAIFWAAFFIVIGSLIVTGALFLIL